MRWLGVSLVVVVTTTGCGLIKGHVAGQYGRQAGRSAAYAIDTVVSAGPSLTAAVVVGADDPDAQVAVGYHATALGTERPMVPRGLGSAVPAVVDSDLALTLGLEAGYQIRAKQGHALGRVGAGWSIVTLNAHVLAMYDGDRVGVAFGPEVDLHLRLGASTLQHEVQVFVRGDFFVVERMAFDHRGVAGLRLMFDLY